MEEEFQVISICVSLLTYSKQRQSEPGQNNQNAASKSQEEQNNGNQRFFKTKWLKIFPWMEIYKSDGSGTKFDHKSIGQEAKNVVVKCRACLEYNPSTKYGKEGVSILKKDLFEQHAKSKAHQTAYTNRMNANGLKTGILILLCKASQEIHSLIKVIKHMLQHNRPNSDFKSLIELNQELGGSCFKTDLYHSQYGFEELLKSMCRTIQRRLFQVIAQSQYFSISIDESTDRSVSSNLIIYGHFIDKKTFDYKPRFLGLIQLKSKTGEYIFEELKQFLKTYNLNLENIIGFTSDGGSNMVGKNVGVSTRIKELNPWLIQNHCLCHKLHLVCKDSDKESEDILNLSQTLKKIYNFLSKSTSKLIELREYQKLREEKQVKVLRFFDIRWLTKFNCVNNLRQTYGSVLDLMKKHKDPLQESNSKIREKAKDLYNRLTSYKTLFLVFVLSDLLNQVSLTFKKWQSESLHVMDLFGEIERLKSFIQINYLSRENISGVFYEDLKEYFSDSSLNLEKTFVQDHNILKSEEEHQETLKITKDFAQSLLDHLQERFQENEFLKALRIFDIRYLIKNLPQLENGQEDFSKDFRVILKHFKSAKIKLINTFKSVEHIDKIITIVEEAVPEFNSFLLQLKMNFTIEDL